MLSPRDEQRNLPDEDEVRIKPAVRSDEDHSWARGAKGAGRVSPDGHVGSAEKRKHGCGLNEADQREGRTRANRERPGAEERRDDADHGDQRLACSDLVAAMSVSPTAAK